MNTRNLIALALVSCTATLSAALPEIAGFTCEQRQFKRTVTVRYALTGAPGIVTAEVLLNGTPLDCSVLRNAKGDINKKLDVSVGNERYAFTWQPNETMPEKRAYGPGEISIRLTAWATNEPPEYAVVDLASGDMNYYLGLGVLPDGGLANDVYRTTKMVLRKIPAAGVEWTMGSTRAEYEGHRGACQNAHPVVLSKNFYAALYETTQKQYETLYGSAASVAFTNAEVGATRPVERVWFNRVRGGTWPKGTWGGATYDGEPASDSFIRKLRDKTGCSGFDLPTEAQWEYACRGGCYDEYPNGRMYWPVKLNGDRDLEFWESQSQMCEANVARLGRFAKNGGMINGTMTPLENPSDPSKDRRYGRSGCSTDYGTSTVGCYEPNGWGLYDMLGNVAEMCLDGTTNSDGARSWIGIFDPTQSVVDPTNAYGPNDGSAEARHICKGGSFDSQWYGVRPAHVDVGSVAWESISYVGFRVFMNLP